ncbi:MAG TPA: SpoIIE family protein phosphatase [Thermoanaerobaculia bacterium]|nr:SpoIIE family protein phosphatase [Thermoanaerobaculia bacterium]
MLQVTPPDGARFERPVDRDELVVGRSPQCDVVVDDRSLSRRHVRFRLDGGALSVEDLGSSNGTLLDARPLQGAVPVAAGARLTLSQTTIEIDERADSVAPAPADPEPLAMTLMRRADELLEPAPPASAPPAELGRYAERLKLVNRLNRELGAAVTVEQALDLALDGVFEHLRPETALIYLVETDGADGGELRLAAARPPEAGAGRPPSGTLRREVVDRAQAVLALDARSDRRFAGAESILAAGAHGLMAAPLADAGGALGMVVLDSRLSVRSFDEDDLELLTSIAAAAAARVRNVRLTRDAIERERLENELRLARRIQMSLLPKRVPRPEGYDVYAANTPSRAVSGDYYQIVERAAGGECALLIADVCGKGIAASLLTATLEAVCAVLLAGGEPAAEVFRAACRFLHQRTPPDKFATACLAVLDVASGRMELVNAGHNPPLVVRAGGAVEELEAGGFPLGLVPESDYESAAPALAPGDVLVLYTDGIVEAEDPAGEQYGSERLTELCRRARGGTAAEIAAALEEDLARFTAGAVQGDDRTYVILRRDG